jgi:hypothetical protein
MLAAALLYLLPLLPFSRPAYTGYMAISMAVHAALILVEAGPFSLSKEVRGPWRAKRLGGRIIAARRRVGEGGGCLYHRFQRRACTA